MDSVSHWLTKGPWVVPFFLEVYSFLLWSLYSFNISQGLFTWDENPSFENPLFHPIESSDLALLGSGEVAVSQSLPDISDEVTDQVYLRSILFCLFI